MDNLNTIAPKLIALGKKIDSLQSEGRAKLRAVLQPYTTETKPSLPVLQGENLAKQHLGLAIDALLKPGTSKPDTFRKIRLLLNSLEQGAHKPNTVTTVQIPQEIPAFPTLGRRARLIHKTFESAQLISHWRGKKTPTEHSQSR